MKYFVAMALVGAAVSINLNRADYDASNMFNEFVVEREGEQPVHLIQLISPPGGAPTWPSPPTNPGRGFTTTQEPGMGKDWPAGGATNAAGEVFEKNPQYGGHHPEMYEQPPSHKWADPYYDPYDQKLHFRNGTYVEPNRNARAMAIHKVDYTNGQAWTYPDDGTTNQGGGPVNVVGDMQTAGGPDPSRQNAATAGFA